MQPRSIIGPRGPGGCGPHQKPPFRFFRRTTNLGVMFISGVTKDSTGATLGGCTVKLFRTDNDTLYAQMISDASGNYSFSVPNDTTYYVVSYKAGAPDVAGTTVNTLTGT